MPFFQELPDVQVEVDQGDVFLEIPFAAIDERVSAVVITPTCDIVNGKAHFIKFVSTVDLKFVIKIIADSIKLDAGCFDAPNVISKNKYEDFLKVLRKNTNGDFLPRFYLLPKYNESVPASYLDMQRVFVTPYEQVKREFLGKRIARICTPWRESIASQYAGYSMRIGTPPYSNDELDQIILAAGLRIPQKT